MQIARLFGHRGLWSIVAVVIGLGVVSASCAVEDTQPAPGAEEDTQPTLHELESTSDVVCQCPDLPIRAGVDAQAQLDAQVPQVCQEICGVCGDHVCNANESSANCPTDCGPASVCGNRVCESGESFSCPSDCNPLPPTQCGNGVCNIGEIRTCPQDCGACVVEPCPHQPVQAPGE